MILSPDEEKSLIRKIFEGYFTVRHLPKFLYFATAKKLMSGVDQAFSNNVHPELYNELRDNIYIFSGAKTYTQVKDISSLILDGRQLRPFSEFKKLAKEKIDLYNETWLKTEYETSIGQAQSAVKWQQIEADREVLPYLVRRAVMDANTSEVCTHLNDIVAPVGDSFWNTRAPLSHFNCRCILEQLGNDAKQKHDPKATKKAVEVTEPMMNPLFKNNPGKTKVIFNESHPYFDIAPKDRAFARKNFNLPMP